MRIIEPLLKSHILRSTAKREPRTPAPRRQASKVRPPQTRRMAPQRCPSQSNLHHLLPQGVKISDVDGIGKTLSFKMPLSGEKQLTHIVELHLKDVPQPIQIATPGGWSIPLGQRRAPSIYPNGLETVVKLFYFSTGYHGFGARHLIDGDKVYAINQDGVQFVLLKTEKIPGLNIKVDDKGLPWLKVRRGRQGIEYDIYMGSNQKEPGKLRAGPTKVLLEPHLGWALESRVPDFVQLFRRDGEPKPPLMFLNIPGYGLFDVPEGTFGMMCQAYKAAGRYIPYKIPMPTL